MSAIAQRWKVDKHYECSVGIGLDLLDVAKNVLHCALQRVASNTARTCAVSFLRRARPVCGWTLAIRTLKLPSIQHHKPISLMQPIHSIPVLLQSVLALFRHPIPRSQLDQHLWLFQVS